MHTNRFVTGFLTVGLVTLAALTAGQAVATAQVLGAGDPAPVAPAAARVEPEPPAGYPNCPFTKEDRQSMKLVYVKGLDRWQLQTSHGPLGVDGGLSALRDCPPLSIWP